MDETERLERKLRAQHTKDYCIVCGATALYISREGASTCEKHSVGGVADPDSPIFDWATGERITQD